MKILQKYYLQKAGEATRIRGFSRSLFDRNFSL